MRLPLILPSLQLQILCNHQKVIKLHHQQFPLDQLFLYHLQLNQFQVELCALLFQQLELLPLPLKLLPYHKQLVFYLDVAKQTKLGLFQIKALLHQQVQQQAYKMYKQMQLNLPLLIFLFQATQQPYDVNYLLPTQLHHFLLQLLLAQVILYLIQQELNNYFLQL